MAALGTKLRSLEGGNIMFWCPGCDLAHSIRHGVPDRPCWEWNGDVERPTFSPSLLVRFVHGSGVCHSFVRDGRIEFLTDSTHALAGQAVDMPDWPHQDGDW